MNRTSLSTFVGFTLLAAFAACGKNSIDNKPKSFKATGAASIDKTQAAASADSAKAQAAGTSTLSSTATSSSSASVSNPTTDAKVAVEKLSPPVIEIIGLPSGASRELELFATVAHPEEITHYRYYLNNGGPCSTDKSKYSDWKSSSQPFHEYLPADLKDGPVGICFYGKNYGNVETDKPRGYAWLKDTSAPALRLKTRLSSTLVNIDKLELYVEGANADAGKYLYSLTQSVKSCDGVLRPDPSVKENVHDIKVPIVENLSTFGQIPFTVCVWGIDAAGNVADSPLAVPLEKDTIPPGGAGLLTLTATQEGATLNQGQFYNYFTVPRVVVSSPDPDVKGYRSVVVEGDASKCPAVAPQPDMSIVIPITNRLPDNDGLVTLCVWGMDDAHNLQIRPTTKSWNKLTAPPAAIIKSGVPKNAKFNRYINPTTQDSLTVVVEGSEHMDHAVFALISASDSCDSPVAMEAYDKSIKVPRSGSFSTGLLAPKEYRICIRAVDKAGNKQAAGEATTETFRKFSKFDSIISNVTLPPPEHGGTAVCNPSNRGLPPPAPITGVAQRWSYLLECYWDGIPMATNRSYNVELKFGPGQLLPESGAIESVQLESMGENICGSYGTGYARGSGWSVRSSGNIIGSLPPNELCDSRNLQIPQNFLTDSALDEAKRNSFNAILTNNLRDVSSSSVPLEMFVPNQASDQQSSVGFRLKVVYFQE